MTPLPNADTRAGYEKFFAQVGKEDGRSEAGLTHLQEYIFDMPGFFGRCQQLSNHNHRFD